MTFEAVAGRIILLIDECFSFAAKLPSFTVPCILESDNAVKSVKMHNSAGDPRYQEVRLMESVEKSGFGTQYGPLK